MPSTKIHRAEKWGDGQPELLCGTRAHEVLATTTDKDVTCSRCCHSIDLRYTAGDNIFDPWSPAGMRRMVRRDQTFWDVYDLEVDVRNVRSKLLDLRDRLEAR